MEVEVISSELIKPSSPTPSELRDFKLSFIDEKIPPFFVPLVLYFMRNETAKINHHEMVNRLKTPLADTLTDFYPLAGRMKGQIMVDCNDEGIRYLVARVDGKILQELVESPEAEDLDQLIPYKSHGSSSIADEQLAVQVNLFKCGGLAIGLCLSHRIADGCSLSTFLKAWSGRAVGQSNGVLPVFGSASLFPPRGTPEFSPKVNSATVKAAVERLQAKRLIFTASEVAEMKGEVMRKSSIEQPTRVEVVSAFLWKCCMAAKGLDDGTTSAACHPVNLRGKLFPRLQEHSFGNILQMAMALASGDSDWVSLFGKLRGAIKKIDEEYVENLQSENGFELHFNNFEQHGELISQGVEVIKFSNWCNLALYEADFGWGKPVWVSTAGYTSQDSVVLFDTKCPGEVEAWVVMSPQEMAKLEQVPEFRVRLTRDDV